MTPVLFIDADNVLLDWLGSFVGFVNERIRQGEIPSTAPWKREDFTDYDMTAWTHGQQHLWAQMDLFKQSDEWGKLPPLCVMTSLEKLVNVGYELRVITQCGDDISPDIRAKRVHNLTVLYGPVFRGIHFVPSSQTKVQWLDDFARSHPAHLIAGLVDDRPETILETAASRRYRAFGVRHEFNRWVWGNRQHNPALLKYRGMPITWVNSVDDVANILINAATQ